MQVQDELERFTSDMGYFEQHRQELLEQYAEQWVAVYDQQVVAAGKDLKRLVSRLNKHGIPASQTFVDYLTHDEDLLILASASV